MAFVSYDSYKNRIEKVAKVKGFVVKYKFLIIGLLAVLIAGISSLLATKGMITSAMVLPAQITYGENYSPAEAAAFLSDVGYEYALQGKDEWTEKKPLKAGKYQVRTVTSKAIGKGYGDPVEFEILSKEVEFVLNNETSLKYGDKPSKYAMDGLVTAYGDRIDGVNFAFNYNDNGNEGDWTVDVTVDAGNVKIVDARGNDSSGSYVYEKVEKTFALAKRDISFSLQNSSDTYQGAEISFKGELTSYTQNMLAEGDRIEYSTKVTQNGVAATLLNAGDYDLSVVESSIKIFNEAGKDITHRYAYSSQDFTGAIFTVNKKRLAITTKGAEKTYDGKPLSKTDEVISDGLISGHRLQLIGDAPSIVNAGSERNVQIFNILDGSGALVSANYDYENDYSYGYLTVTPRPITIRTESEKWTYDGAAHSTEGKYEITSGSLAEGQKIFVYDYKSVTDVRDTQSGNNAVYFNIVGGQFGETLVDLNNYAITYDFGTLTVNKRPITVSTGSQEFEYDGYSHGYNYPADLSTLIKDGALALSSHRLEISGSKFTVTNVADTKAENNVTKFRVVSGGWYGEDESDNYLISYENGTLTVTARPITVVINPAEKVYDGIALSSTAYGTLYAKNAYETGLLGGDTLTPVAGSANSITNVAQNITNNVEFTVSDNYVIEGYDRTNATLTVTKRPITVVIKSAEKVYDGTPLSSTAYDTHYFEEPLKDGLIGSDILTPVQGTVNSIIDAVGTQNTVEFTATGNYEIKNYDRTAATLKITQVQLTVRLKDMRVTYGDEISYEIKEGNYLPVSGSLVAGEKLTVTEVDYNYDKTLIHPKTGSYYVTPVGYTIKKADGTLSNGNYNLHIDPADLTIEKRAVTVKLNSYTITYGDDGDTVYKGGGETLAAGSNPLADGENLSVFNATVVWESRLPHPSAGTHDITCTQSENQIIGADGDTSSNYDITFETGVLTVNKRKITFTTPSATFTYNGKLQYKTFFDDGREQIAGEGVASSEYAVWSNDYTKVKDYTPAPVENRAELEIWYMSWHTTDNYDITTDYGSLTVEKREITIESQTNLDGLIYNGAKLYDDGFTITSGDLAPGCKHQITVTSYTELVDVSAAVDNVQTYKITDGAEDVTKNYAITPVSGKIKINPREIEVTVNSTAIYGNPIAYTKGDENATNLVAGHEITVDTSGVNYAVSGIPDVGGYDITLDSSAVKVFAGSREVTGNYTVIPKIGKLTITKRPITVELNDKTAIYGVKFEYEEVAENYKKISSDLTLIDDEKLTVFVSLDSNDFPYDVGDYRIYAGETDYSVEKADGTDGSNNYDITFVDGAFKVTKRGITVKALSYTVKYGDSTAHVTGVGNYANALELYKDEEGAETLELTVFDYEFGDGYPTVGTYWVRPTACKIYKKDGGDSTGNYAVEYKDGELTVERAEIEVKLKRVIFPYGADGYYGKTFAELYAAKFDSVELPYGETLTLKVSFVNENGEAVTPRHAGRYFAKIANEETENYKLVLIDEEQAILDVIPRNIRLIPKPVTAVYGAVAAQVNYPSGKSNFDILETDADDDSNYGPAYGDEFEVFASIDFGGQTLPDAGLYDLIINGIKVHYGDGAFAEASPLPGNNVFESTDYTFHVSYKNAVEITQKEVAVTLNSYVADYGDSYAYQGGEEEFTPALVGSDKLGVINAYPDCADNASVGDYFVTCDQTANIVLKSDGTDNTKNYKITFVDGIFTVNPRKITVTLANATSIYGEPLGVPEITVALKNGDEFNPKYLYLKDGESPKRYDVDEYDIHLDEGKSAFVYSNGAPSTIKNYEIIEVVPSTLTVTPRPIKVTLKDITCEYGRISSSGVTFHYEDIEEVLLSISGEYGLVPDETPYEAHIRAVKNSDSKRPEMKNVGSYDVELYMLHARRADMSIDRIMLSASGNYTNYQITEDSVLTATLKITPKSVTVNLDDIKTTYGDKDSVLTGYSYETTDGLAFNEILTLENFALSGGLSDYRLNAGTYPVDPLIFTATVSDGTSKIDGGENNYKITVEGNLVVEPKTVGIELFEFEGDYYYGDGEKLIYPAGVGNYVSDDELAYGQRLEVVLAWFDVGNPVDRPVNAGTYDYVIGDNSVIYDENGNAVSGGYQNYNFVCLGGEVEIQKFTVDFHTLSDTVTYDGKPYAYPTGWGNYEADYPESQKLPYGERMEIFVKFINETGVTVTPVNAGTYTIAFKEFTRPKILAGDNPDATQSNYEFWGYDGTLKIEHRSVFVIPLQFDDFIYGESVSYPIYEGNHGDLNTMWDGLAEGHFLTITSVYYMYADGKPVLGVPTEVGSYNVCAGFVDITDGVNLVDSNYVNHYSFTTFNIVPREITLKTNSATWTYDGKDRSDTGYTLYLQNGSEFTLPQEEADKVIVKEGYTVVKDVCKNVENVVEYDFSQTNYRIENTEYGSLTVLPLEITLVTESHDSFIYDGDFHFNWVSGVLCEIDSFDFEVDNFATITDAGSTPNTAQITAVYDENGDSVKLENFDIRNNFGLLVVKPRPLTVVTGDSLGNVYDGKPHGNENYAAVYYYNEPEKAGLLNGDGLSVDNLVTLTHAGVIDNDTTYTPDSSNYEIKNYLYGTLEVTPLHISVGLIPNPNLIYGDEAYSEAFGNFVYLDGSDKLVTGELLRIFVKYTRTDEPETTLLIAKSVGTYTVYLRDYEVLSTDGTDGKDDYIIDVCEEAEITISPKEITVTLLSFTNEIYGEKFDKYYDGYGNYERLTGGLAYDEKLEVFVKYLDKDGQVVEPEERTPAGSYAITIDYCKINGEYFYDLSAGENGCGNYVVSFTDGLLKINPRPVVVVTGGYLGEYDGEIHSNPVYEKTYLKGYPEKAGVLEGDGEIILYVNGTATEVIDANSNEGGAANEAEYSLNQDNPLSVNYEIAKYDYGYLIVTPVEITIELIQIDDVSYSGSAISYNGKFEYAENSKRLIDGEELTVAVAFFEDFACTANAEPKNAGTYYYAYDNANSVVSGSKSGIENGIGNYVVKCSGVLSVTIDKLDVTISLTPWAEEEYNGNHHEFQSDWFTIVDGNFADGETLSVRVNYYFIDDGKEFHLLSAPKNAREYRVEFDDELSSVNGLPANTNYNVIADDIFFTIGRKKITISMGDESRVYDGTDYDYVNENTGFTVSGKDDIPSETIIPEVVYLNAEGEEVTPKTVGKYIVKFHSFDASGNGTVVGNYELVGTVEDCVLEITKREITVTVNDGEERNIEIPEFPVNPLTDEYFDSDYQGAFGFTEEDFNALTPFYYYTLNGAPVASNNQVQQIGEYEVYVRFDKITYDDADLWADALDKNLEILKNYQISKVIEGTLIITARKVGVAPVFVNGFTGETTYDGEPVNLENFGFEDWHLTNPEEGGFAEGYNPEPKFVFTDENGKVISAPVNAGIYEVTVEFPKVSDKEYLIDNSSVIYLTIKQREVTVSIACEDMSIFDDLKYDNSYLPNSGVTVESEGILDKDKSEYSVFWYFYNVTNFRIFLDNSKATNYAGDYEIRAKLNDENGNYFIDPETEWDLGFTVEKVKLYITPVGRNELYNRQTLYLTDYQIRYGELVEGDRISITGSDSLNRVRKKSVTIKDVKVYHDYDEVSFCYDLHYTYDAKDELLGKADWYVRENFSAMLEFTPRTINYEQLVLDDAHRIFTYNGQKVDLGVDANTPNLITLLNAGNILTGDKLQLKVIPVQNAGVYERWVQILVFDAQTNANITALYDFKLQNAEASKVIVNGNDLALTVNLSDEQLENAWANKDGDNGVLTLSQHYGEYGYYVLSSSYYTVNSQYLNDNSHNVEVLVSEKDGTLSIKVIVFGLSSSNSRTEKSMCYSLTVTTSLSADTELTFMGKLKTLATTNSQAESSALYGGQSL